MIGQNTPLFGRNGAGALKGWWVVFCVVNDFRATAILNVYYRRSQQLANV